MSDKQKQSSQLSDKPFIDQIKEKSDNLAKYGGFDLLESAIDDVQNLNPDRKARRKMFLTENNKKQERESLLKILSLWSDTLKSGDDIIELVQAADDKAKESQETYTKNIKRALEETRELEASYRSVALFYKNTDMPSLKNVTVINAELDQLTDLDNTRFFDYIREELESKYDRLDLRENYSLMVLPGYLGSKSVVDKWAKLAHENKVTLVTDFAHLDEPDDVMEMFESANLASGDTYLSNTIMTCNWLVGRGKYEEVGEEEDVYVPPSGALAGKIYKTLMSQVTAGKKHGGLSEVDGVRFDLRKSEIANLENLGLVPMVNEYGQGNGLFGQDPVQWRQPGATDLFRSTCFRLCDQSVDGLPEPKGL